MIDYEKVNETMAEVAESMASRQESDKLDFFAGCALAGILASLPAPVEGGKTYGWEHACQDAYTGAEAMMKERERRMQS